MNFPTFKNFLIRKAEISKFIQSSLPYFYIYPGSTKELSKILKFLKYLKMEAIERFKQRKNFGNSGSSSNNALIPIELEESFKIIHKTKSWKILGTDDLKVN